MCSERVFLGRPSHILLESRKRDFFLGGGGGGHGAPRKCKDRG